MAVSATTNSDESDRLLRQAADGDKEAFGTLLTQHRDRLRRMIALRLDQRLQGRVDPSDVLQEVYLEASARPAEYLQRPAFATNGDDTVAIHDLPLGQTNLVIHGGSDKNTLLGPDIANVW